MSEHESYPRMLYRPGEGKGEMVWGQRIDTLTVESSAEERAAHREGWLNDPQTAVKGATRRQRAVSVWAFYKKHWQWLWGTLVAIVLAACFH
jgi:hypothetical protein